MLQVASLGDYYADVSDDQSTCTNLRERLTAVCAKRPRRIDRFIELSLLGSGLCAASLPEGMRLDSQTALYIASGLASMSNVVKVQQQIFVHGEPPKPASFINTLSNSAGYHVARNLDLTGKNIFVSRQNSSFEAILQLAALDFATGASRAALLGVVDECPSPLANQRQRMRLQEGAPLAEGSHWFLLQPAASASSYQPLASISTPRTMQGVTQLAHWLGSQSLDNSALHFIGDVSQLTECADLLAGLPEFVAPLGHYGARSAGIVCRFISTGKQASLLSINQDKMGRFHVMRVDRAD